MFKQDKILFTVLSAIFLVAIFAVTAFAQSVTLDIDPAEECVEGDTVSFTANAEDFENPEYKFIYRKSGESKIYTRQRGQDNVWVETAPAGSAGLWDFAVQVREEGESGWPGIGEAGFDWFEGYEIKDPNPPSVTLTIDPAETAAVGDEVVFSAQSENVVDPYYEFLYRGEDGNVHKGQTGSNSEWAVTVLDAHVGSWDFAVQVRENGSRVALSEIVFEYEITEEPAETDPEETVYDEAGIYGPEDEEAPDTIEGDVVIKADGVTLQNLIITDDLIIAEEVGDGNVTLNNLEVKGELIIRGGGADSIYVNGGEYSNIRIENVGGKVRVVAVGVVGDDGEPVDVVIAEGAAGEEINLEGDFDEVTIEGEGSTVNIGEGSTVNIMNITENGKETTINIEDDSIVDELNIDGEDATIQGDGTVNSANVNADGASFQEGVIDPDDVTVGDDVEDPDFFDPADPDPDPDPGPGPGPGPTPEPDPVPVSAITVEQQDQNLAINETLQLTVDFDPSNATDQRLTWLSDNTDVAVVDGNGLITAESAGTATITATSDCNSDAKDTIEITVDAGRIKVSTADQLEGALNNSDIDTIYFTSKITAAPTAEIAGQTIEGNNYTLTGDLSVDADDVTIKDLTVTGTVTVEDNNIDDFTAEGTNFDSLTIEGGGPESIRLRNAFNDTIEVNKSNVRIRMRGSSSNNIVVRSTASNSRLDFTAGSSSQNPVNVQSGAKNVKVASREDADITVEGEGNFSKIILYTVTFEVEDQDDAAISGAEVEIVDEETATTDAQGEVEFDLENATYTYNVTATGYEDVTDESVKVDGDDVAVSVTMTAIEVTGVTIPEGDQTMEVGDTVQLSADITPPNALDQTITWSTNDDSVADVDANGEVTAVALGTATITATSADKPEDTVAITVVEPFSAINFTSTPDLQEGEPNVADEAVVGELSVVGGEGEITYSLVAGDGDDNNDAFKIEGNKVKVDGDALTEGTYKFRVKAEDEEGSELKAAFEITVLAEPAVDPVVNVTQDKSYDDIQAAVDDANPNDTIEVAEGVYEEQVTVHKSLTIKGPFHDTVGHDTGRDGETGEAIIEYQPDPTQGDDAAIVVITADDVEFKGFSVRNGGVFLNPKEGGAVRGIAGIGILDASGGIIENNIAYGNVFGIAIVAENNNLSGNQIKGNYLYDNVYKDEEGKIVSGDSGVEAGRGIMIDRFGVNKLVTGTIIESNHVRGSADGIYLYAASETIVGTENNGNVLYKNYHRGIHLLGGNEDNQETNTTIAYNNIYNNGIVGFSGIFDVDDAEIYNTMYARNSVGIRIAGAQNNTVEHNEIYNTAETGGLQNKGVRVAWRQSGGETVGIIPTGNVINNNKIFGHDEEVSNVSLPYQYGVDNREEGEQDPYTVDATENWWGDETGPYHDPKNTDGEGNEVSENVDFIPWLDADGELVTDVTVLTSAGLESALSAEEIETIILGDDITGNFTAERAVDIDFQGYHIDGNLTYEHDDAEDSHVYGDAETSHEDDYHLTDNLTVNTPNASFTNGINVGGDVNIIDVAPDSWIENADGNTLIISDGDGATITINGDPADITITDDGENITIIVADEAVVESIVVDTGSSGIKIVNNGTITEIENNGDITEYKGKLPDTEIGNPLFKVGDTGPAGGIIFFVKDARDNNTRQWPQSPPIVGNFGDYTPDGHSLATATTDFDWRYLEVSPFPDHYEIPLIEEDAPTTGQYQLALQSSEHYWDLAQEYNLNSSFVSVFVNGDLVIEDATIGPDDPNPKYYTFNANSGDVITTVYIVGDRADWTYYAIKDPNDNIIAEEGGTWKDPGANAPGLRSRVPWGGKGTETGATAVELGMGKANTDTIISKLQGSTYHAAYIADQFERNGFDDWYLPTQNELHAIWVNLLSDGSDDNDGRGARKEGSDDIIRSGAFWSSQENNENDAWGYSFINGISYNSRDKERITEQMLFVRAF